jgi:hypothetical protein
MLTGASRGVTEADKEMKTAEVKQM